MPITKFEKENVIDIYEEISKHFDKTRYHTWPIIQKFTDSFKENTKVADVGCGNGRNCLLRKDINYTGFDPVINFVNICKNKGINAKISDILDIKNEDNYFDYTMCIAVIHHLSDNNRRIKSINELVRITKPNGKILIYVWAKEQERFKNEKTKDVYVRWQRQKRENECDEKVFYRYYYLFEEGELENMIKKNIKNVKILENGYQKDNYYVILEKLDS